MNSEPAASGRTLFITMPLVTVPHVTMPLVCVACEHNSVRTRFGILGPKP